MSLPSEDDDDLLLPRAKRQAATDAVYEFRTRREVYRVDLGVAGKARITGLIRVFFAKCEETVREGFEFVAKIRKFLQQAPIQK